MENPSKKQLGVADLSCYGIGNCIGSGIFVSLCVSMTSTGRSITLAVILANVIVLFAYAYKTLMSGMFALPGGRYGQSVLLQPPLLFGISAVMLVFGGFGYSMYALSVVEYASTVFPVLMEYKTVLAIAIITLFFLTTLFGAKFMGRFNLIMVVVLLVSLLVYIVAGIPQVDWALVNPFSEGSFSGGAFGFIVAAATMSFACQGATMPIDMTSDTRDPKRSLPKSILLSSLVVLVFYVLITIVTAGILPMEEVAGKNLGVIAEAIFPRPVFVLFILGGACMAIATSLYSSMAGAPHPLLAAVDDGWLPKFLGKKTKKGYPWVIMLLLYSVSILLLFFDFGLQEIISLTMIPTMLLNTANNILFLRLVKKYPAAWKKSFFHMPHWLTVVVAVFAALCSLLITVSLLTTLTGSKQILLLVIIAALVVYCVLRLKSGKVDLSKIESFRAQLEKEAEQEED